MTVTIHVSGGVGVACWHDECNQPHEEYVGEVSDSWLYEGHAEKYFAKKLGEEIQLEVEDDECS